MARSVPVTRIPVTNDDRTWRATIETPLGGPYQIFVHRQWVGRDAQGGSIGEPTPGRDITRQASAVVAETVTVTVNEQPVTVSAGLVMAALPLFFDRWAEEDEAAAE